MNIEDFENGLKCLVDAAIGDVDSEQMIEALEARIGVVRARMEEDEQEEAA